MSVSSSTSHQALRLTRGRGSTTSSRQQRRMRALEELRALDLSRAMEA